MKLDIGSSLQVHLAYTRFPSRIYKIEPSKKRAANCRSQEERESGISHPLKYGGSSK